MKKQIFSVVMLFVLLMTIDYFNIFSIKRISLDFFTGILNVVVIIILFLITYHTLDRVSKEKEQNKKEIAKILVNDIYKQVDFMLENILTDDIVENNIVPKIDFNACGEHELITNLKKDPFRNEGQLYNLIEDGQLSKKDFLKYLEIKKDYSSYITMRVVFFDHKERYNPLREKLLQKLSKEMH